MTSCSFRIIYIYTLLLLLFLFLFLLLLLSLLLSLLLFIILTIMIIIIYHDTQLLHIYIISRETSNIGRVQDMVVITWWVYCKMV